MDDVDLLFANEMSQSRYQPQGEQGFMTDWPFKVFAADRLNLLHHGPALRDDDRAMAIGRQGRTNINRALLDPATAQ